ncbi:hypothetical protein, partial [Burkholderia sp. AU4i]|uniref:hypothetical protein n=1 Tax=Burkholderia sp. AU4i TaxID=1335308 RepID=UPI001C54E7A2
TRRRPMRARAARRPTRPRSLPPGSPRNLAGARKPRADVCMGRKKARTAGSGLIHHRRRVEETFGGCRSATTNEAHYTNASSTPQENLHCEIKRHNMKFNAARLNRCFSLLNQ